jgi:hypothetical protein
LGAAIVLCILADLIGQIETQISFADIDTLRLKETVRLRAARLIRNRRSREGSWGVLQPQLVGHTSTDRIVDANEKDTGPVLDCGLIRAGGCRGASVIGHIADGVRVAAEDTHPRSCLVIDTAAERVDPSFGELA